MHIIRKIQGFQLEVSTYQGILLPFWDVEEIRDIWKVEILAIG